MKLLIRYNDVYNVFHREQNCSVSGCDTQDIKSDSVLILQDNKSVSSKRNIYWHRKADMKYAISNGIIL